MRHLMTLFLAILMASVFVACGDETETLNPNPDTFSVPDTTHSHDGDTTTNTGNVGDEVPTSNGTTNQTDVMPMCLAEEMETNTTIDESIKDAHCELCEKGNCPSGRVCNDTAACMDTAWLNDSWECGDFTMTTETEPDTWFPNQCEVTPNQTLLCDYAFEGDGVALTHPDLHFNSDKTGFWFEIGRNNRAYACRAR